MITTWLKNLRAYRRQRIINRILVKRAGLRARLEGGRRGGYIDTGAMEEIAEYNETLRQLRHEEEP